MVLLSYSKISALTKFKTERMSNRHLVQFPRNENQVKNLCIVASQRMSETSDEYLLLIDETWFNFHIAKLYDWAPKEMKAITIAYASKGQNLCEIILISSRGLEACKAVDGIIMRTVPIIYK
ncbi:MAG: hypothetical protein EZS28_027633 [Streblomastix strix]|uniref:Uncharacterized protein n=1 Tax=Streblomastix strix TaxID=222440 RepID=A0A5J4V352_9EUKA|nr:MAG: hypothetical protein EZS28_027633 [Streblomastix strix]